MRLALGAGPWHIGRLLLTESVLLALCGGFIGAALALWGTNALSAVPPMRVRGIPISLLTTVDGTGLVVAVLLGLGCGLLFGLVPALQLSRRSATTPPRDRPRPSRRGLRNLLMAVEVALAVVVLLVAGTFFGSFMATRSMDPGFRRDGVLLAAYDLRQAKTDGATRQFASRLLTRLRGLPAVSGAAIALGGDRSDIHGLPVRFISVEGRPRERQRSRSGARDDGHAGLLRRHGNPAARAERISRISTIAPRRRRSSSTKNWSVGSSITANHWGGEWKPGAGGSSLPVWRATPSTTRSASRPHPSCTFRIAISPAPSARFT